MKRSEFVIFQVFVAPILDALRLFCKNKGTGRWNVIAENKHRILNNLMKLYHDRQLIPVYFILLLLLLLLYFIYFKPD